MLQQTQATRVGPAFKAFMARFPTVRDLARASRGEVLRAWAGLGYNRRAVALSDAAKTIVSRHRGRVPRDPDDLRRLPGIGPYTARAVAAIAYGVPVAAIDTNVARVVGRAMLGVDGLGVRSRWIEDGAERWLDRSDPATWNQALMDLGREVCRPVPRCDVCPLAKRCRFRLAGRHPVRRSGRQPPFAGSFRQLRGTVIRTLRHETSVSLGEIARHAGEPLERIAAAVTALANEGLLAAGRAALAGRPRGRVRLPS
jgi:A/G-specific adenine glycosylase